MESRELGLAYQINLDLFREIEKDVYKYCNSNYVENVNKLELLSLYYDVVNYIGKKNVSRKDLSAIVVGRMIVRGWMHRVDEYAPIQHTRGILQLNPFLGCTCGCLYCFRNDDEGGLGDFYFGNKPVQFLSVEECVDQMENHKWFIPNVTQIGINTASTDAFLPQVKNVTFQIIDEIVRRGYKNDILLITKMYLTKEDVERLDSYENDILLLLTYTANRENIEPVIGKKKFREKQFKEIEYLNLAKKLKWGHYYRPLVEGWNDSEEQIIEALEFGSYSCTSVIGGLKLLTNMKEIVKENNIEMPIGDFKDRSFKYLSPRIVDKIINIYERKNYKQVLVNDQSCGIAIIKGEYGKLAPNAECLRLFDEYNLNNKFKSNREDNNLLHGCLGRCSEEQLSICSKKWQTGNKEVIVQILEKLEFEYHRIEVNCDGVNVLCNEVVPSQDQIMAAMNILKMPIHVID